MYECTWIVNIVVREPKEEVNTRNNEPFHPHVLRVSCINEDAVPTGSRDVTSRPEWRRADDLAIHPSRAWWIARCAECCCGWMVDRHFRLPYHGAIGKCQLVGFDSRRGFELVKKEAAREVEEVVLVDLKTERLKRSGVFPGGCCRLVSLNAISRRVIPYLSYPRDALRS